MTTICRENADRLSVAVAKRLILDAVPLEKAVDIYAQVDDQGNINWEGNIECRVNEKANIPASHLDNDFYATCNALGIRPRMKYRPVITDYAGNVSQDGFYTIAHNEFVKIAELFGLQVELGVSSETAAPTLQPLAAVCTSNAPHLTKTRRDTLTPVIEFAMSKCRQASDTAEVWAQLQQLAAEKHPPLIGQVEEGLQYRLSGEVKYFTKHALDGRLQRSKKKGPTKPR